MSASLSVLAAGPDVALSCVSDSTSPCATVVDVVRSAPAPVPVTGAAGVR